MTKLVNSKKTHESLVLYHSREPFYFCEIHTNIEKKGKAEMVGFFKVVWVRFESLGKSLPSDLNGFEYWSFLR